MNQVIDRIHDLPILSVIEKYITIRKAGISYKAKCPFPGHDDKTASFSVSVNKNICKCFGCGRGGDAITFVQLFNQHPKPWDAIKEICAKFNIPIPDQKEFTPEQQEAYKKHEQLKIVYDAAAEYYNKNLFDPSSAIALEYLLSRTSNELIEKFELGCASGSWTGLLDHMKAKGFKTDILLESKLISEKNGKMFDFFRHRIMIPICDASGSVVAFSGRIHPGATDDQPKYINSPETPIFSKSRTLFGLNHARTSIQKKEGVYLVEGPFDLLRMVSIGVENTVAPSGTALTTDQISLLQRYTQNSVIIFDADQNQSGAKAADRAGKMMVEASMNCNVIMLPGGDGKADPDTFFTSADIFKKYKLWVHLVWHIHFTLKHH
jgi:DNA primase